jgi:glycosyltransferase involved in cell wall biosynthesis
VQPKRGGFTEIVEQAQSGLLVEPDNVDALAEGILSLANNPELAAQFSDNGFTKVREHYSVARMAESALDAYRSVIPEVQSAQGR